MKALLAILGMLTLNFIATFIFSLLWSLPCEVRQITSNAMLPTLKPNDLVFVEKFSPYINHSFKRGEIVLFYPDFLNAKEKNSWQKMQLAIARIKGETGEAAHFRRIAGLQGDVVEVYCPSSKIILPPNIENQIGSNQTELPKGSQLVKIFYRGKEAQSLEQKCVGRYAIAKGYLFLIGDNTDYLGILEEAKIFGRPQFRFSDFNTIEPQGTNIFVISKEERSQ